MREDVELMDSTRVTVSIDFDTSSPDIESLIKVWTRGQSQQRRGPRPPVALAGVRPAASPAVGRAATLQQRHAAAALGSDTPLPPSATWGCWERAGRQEVG